MRQCFNGVLCQCLMGCELIRLRRDAWKSIFALSGNIWKDFPGLPELPQHNCSSFIAWIIFFLELRTTVCVVRWSPEFCCVGCAHLLGVKNPTSLCTVGRRGGWRAYDSSFSGTFLCGFNALDVYCSDCAVRLLSRCSVFVSYSLSFTVCVVYSGFSTLEPVGHLNEASPRPLIDASSAPKTFSRNDALIRASAAGFGETTVSRSTNLDLIVRFWERQNTSRPTSFCTALLGDLLVDLKWTLFCYGIP